MKDSDANTILSLTATETGKRYPQVRLLKDPEGADTIEYRFYRAPRILSVDSDIPDIPYPHSRILVWDTLLLLASYDEAPRPRYWEGEQAKQLKGLQNKYLEGQALGARPRMVRDVRN